MIEPFIDIKIDIDIPNSNISNINLQKWRNPRFAAQNFRRKARRTAYSHHRLIVSVQN